MNNFAEKFEQLENDLINEQRKLPVDSPLSIFYGLTIEKYYRLSFISKTTPFELESTKEIRVTQGKESDGVYWTCFDLLNEEAKDVFFIFCESLIDAISGEQDETRSLSLIRDRYYSWKLLMKTKGKMSYEMYQGLFGELFFLLERIAKKVPIEDAISAWVGPDGYSKDFSINSNWFELKTIGTTSATIKVNSLAQLDSDINGHLVVIVVERMSDQFDDGLCSVHKLYEAILSRLHNPIIEEMFKNKVLRYGYIDSDNSLNNHKFKVKEIQSYCVDKEFPRITRSTINNPAISNVTYEILINAIERFMEDYK